MHLLAAQEYVWHEKSNNHNKFAMNRIGGWINILSPAALGVVYLYYEKKDFITNLSGITQRTGASFPTTRKAVNALTDAGILTELNIGRSRVIRLNEGSKVAKLIFELFDELKEEHGGGKKIR